MTSATKHTRRYSVGFTLIELLIVIGIIGLLAGILLTTVSRLYSSAKASRTKSDLLSITTALEAYKADYGGSYPPVTDASSGAAVLCKALIGPYDAAHYYKLNSDGEKAAIADSDPVINAPDKYDANRVYNPGDVVLGGAAPTFPIWVAGAQNTIFISTKGENKGHSPVNGGLNPVDDGCWWAVFSPYDGNDGPGGRNRLGLAAQNDAKASVPPHAPAGTVFGPYLKPESFRVSGVALLDSNDSPILYFSLNKQAKVTDPNGLIGNVGYTPAATVVRPLINATDNLNAFFNEAATPTQDAAIMLAKMKVVLGDYNQNGAYDASATPNEPASPDAPFLLWTAGPDRKFGPRGNANPATDGTKFDFYTDAAHASENAATQAACDDVTNFR